MNRVKLVKESWKLMSLLPSIGKTIGILESRLNRCKIDSPRYKLYEKNKNNLLHQQAEINSTIKSNMFLLLSNEEQDLFFKKD